MAAAERETGAMLSRTTSSGQTSSTSTPSPTTSNSSEASRTPSSDSDAVNLYYIFLVLFAIMFFAAIYFCHRTSRRRKALSRSHGQSALLQDLDGWPSTRRWLHGSWAHGRDEHRYPREEGLDERGQAPPPYEPASEQEGAASEGGYEGNGGLAVPLRVHTRDDAGRKPPEYEETELTSRDSTDIGQVNSPVIGSGLAQHSPEERSGPTVTNEQS